MTPAGAELVRLLLVSTGGVAAGLWPGWTAACAWIRWREQREQRRAWAGEEDHAAAWDAEFSAARTVTYVLPARDRRRPGYSPSAIERWLNEGPPPALPYRAHQHADPYGAPCWCGAAPFPFARPPAAGAIYELSEPLRELPPAPGPEELSERAATIQEIAADAEYRLTWGQLSDLARSAYDWYDMTFETGEFRRIEP